MQMRSKTFTVGFLLGLVLFVAANFYSYSQMYMPCDDCTMSFGMPFRIWQFGGFVSVAKILWLGLVLDVAIAVCASFLLGWALEKLFGVRRALP
jgi:hypothetical protein